MLAEQCTLTGFDRYDHVRRDMRRAPSTDENEGKHFPRTGGGSCLIWLVGCFGILQAGYNQKRSNRQVCKWSVSDVTWMTLEGGKGKRRDRYEMRGGRRRRRQHCRWLMNGQGPARSNRVLTAASAFKWTAAESGDDGMWFKVSHNNPSEERGQRERKRVGERGERNEKMKVQTKKRNDRQERQGGVEVLRV